MTSSGALVSAWALDDDQPATSSGLTVRGSVTAASGAALILGCEMDHFPCYDDPTGTSATVVGGELTATDPLGAILHDVTVGADLMLNGGGGGTVCASSPSNVFDAIPGNGGAVYSDVEDVTVGGDCRSPTSIRAGSVPCATRSTGAPPSRESSSTTPTETRSTTTRWAAT